MSSYLDLSALGLESSHPRGSLFWVVASILVYIPFSAVVRRHQLRHTVRTHASLANMTLEEAYVIKHWLAEHEFPTVFSAALKFAVFKSEGIPSVAKLVDRVAQRAASASKAPEKKRPSGPGLTPADLLGRPSAPATVAAVARVNRIHSLYRPSGVMSDADMLYTLSLFALEPGRLIARFEWRGLTVQERCALATLWKALGEELRIPFDPLPSSGKGGFRDALHWLGELEEWGRDYEARYREKSPETVAVADRKLDTWTGNVPKRLRPVARSFLAALIEPGLRRAKGIETPPAASVFIVESMVNLRRFIRGYFPSPVLLIEGYRHG
ncbi:hypothetical protein F4859DRAFT_506202 [Xylaria cf. heliscus]|nr:hypothetical protein F4859DRAFT_506202 [Xylaria cf. heliscus]